jgi:hypothetical protein
VARSCSASKFAPLLTQSVERIDARASDDSSVDGTLELLAAWQALRSLQRGHCVAHNWWTYQIVTGPGGRMLYRDAADTLYRQHEANAVGSNTGRRAALERIRMVLGGRFKAWNEVNLTTLNRCRDPLSPEAVQTLELFTRARRGPLPARLRGLSASHVYRQSVRGNLSLWGRVFGEVDLMFCR